jgi:hypothetical protein
MAAYGTRFLREPLGPTTGGYASSLHGGSLNDCSGVMSLSARMYNDADRDFAARTQGGVVTPNIAVRACNSQGAQ